MGSICSTRQSTKDNTSEPSDEYKPNEEKPKTEAAHIQEKTFQAENDKEKSKEGDISTKRNNGSTAVVSAPPAPKGASTDISRAKSVDDKQASLSEDLPDLRVLSEGLRNLIEGRISSPYLDIKSEGVCVCLVGDSTDSGKERSFLEAYISKEFPSKLDCTSRDFWTINLDTDKLESYSLDRAHLITEYIKEQQTRCHVFTIIFLSETVGQLKPPPLILKSDYDTILESLENGEDKTLLDRWYQEDSLATRPFVKLNWTINVPTKEYETEFAKIASIFLSVKNDKIKEHYLKTPLEQTIEGLLDKKDKTTTAFWVKKEGGNDQKKDLVSVLPPEEDKIRTEKLNKHLSDCIPKERIISIGKQSTEDAYTKILSSELEKIVKNGLQNEKTRTTKPIDNNLVREGIKVSILREIFLHQECCRSHKTKNAHKNNLLNDLQKYLTDSSSNILVIEGSEGSGKSFLAASAASHCHEWANGNPCLIYRTIGASASSRNLESLLWHLYEHCLLLYGPPKTPRDPSNIPSNMIALLEKASSFRPLVIVIDGLDHLRHSKDSEWHWLPNKLPEYVKIVLTVKSETGISKALASKKNIQRLEIKNDSGEESEMVLKNMAAEANKSLPPSLLENVKSSKPIPLQLLFLSRLLMLLENEEGLSSISMSDVIKAFLERLKKTFKKESVEIVLGCLTMAKLGLKEDEILSLLQSSNESTQDNNCIGEWLLLRRILRPLLQTKEENKICLTCFSSETLCRKLKTTLLESKDSRDRCSSALRKLTSKSSIESLVETFDPDEYIASPSSVRALQENPPSGAEETNLLFNHKYIHLKLLTCGPTQILEDLKCCLQKHPDNKDLSLLKDFFAFAFTSLELDPSQLYLQLYGRLKCHISSDEMPKIASLVKEVSKSSHTWILPLSSCFSPLGQAQEENKSGAKMTFNFLFRIPSNSNHIVSISTEKGELIVWDVLNMTPIRTLKGINQPRKMEMIDENKCLLLCGRELRIYDLNKGAFLMKLREVMNQKMPFFGLHNSDHVVALSRSRMYVNMMNLTEGNCVTTFKVGEDRFLSSLTVSENGKICVCGDDSQKPSALLVWDLENRKLLYDLRIPHHGFIMKLVAITEEGHYVGSVCREIDEPAPNFIVVYDLQSGTLFKRWKPAVNTISITISTPGSCVIVGLEDASVMAYDLITGNPRWTAQGHYYPPDTFKFNPDGTFILSYDSEAKDMSLRAWDVSTGKSLAVLTPDHKIVATEVICEGKVIALALEGQSQLMTFVLQSQENCINKSNIKIFGDHELKGQTFDLGEASGT